MTKFMLLLQIKNESMQAGKDFGCICLFFFFSHWGLITLQTINAVTENHKKNPQLL